MSKFTMKAWALFEFILPWVMLVFLTYFTFIYFFIIPYPGAYISQLRTVLDTFGSQSDANSLKPDDLIQRVGTVTYDDTQKDLTKGYFENNKPGDLVEIVVQRQGQLKKIQYIFPKTTLQEVMGTRFNSQWFIPYIFWLAGTVSLLFLRPRSVIRFILALFCYLTAAWLSASTFSGYNYMNGSLLLRSEIWLSVPVYLHLHWLFPTPLRRLPGWLWGILYALAGCMAVISWMQLVPPNFYSVGFIIALVGSLILLGAHLVTQPAERRSLAGMVAALGMVLIPVLGIIILTILNIRYAFAGIVVLGLAALPGFYFYTLFRRQLTPGQALQTSRLVRLYLIVIFISLLFSFFLTILSQSTLVFRYLTFLNQMAVFVLLLITMVNFLPFLALPALADERLTVSIRGGRLSFSANRAATGVIFILLETMIVLALASLFQLFPFPGANELALVMAMLLMGSGALLFYRPFKSFFERRMLGISLMPESLVKLYAGRITTSLENSALRTLLVEEVLPSLLVRQFAQMSLCNGELVFDFGLRVPVGDALTAAQLSRYCGYFLKAGLIADMPGWIRLVLPLQTNNETSGYWVLGHRDPDDHYSEEDISTLQALADQTALAMVNIQQADNLRALYFADIDRHEVERLHLAAELHDDVLGQMSVLSQNLQDTSLTVISAYDQSVARIREIINGLRPAMLNFGAGIALESLMDELNERHPEGPQVVMELSHSDLRYDSRVELYLFRVIQQACSNAIQHARCNTIRINGSFSTDKVVLQVIDDGQGFPAGQGIDLPALLSAKHFGLAGMYERASLIGAELLIESSPGQGCRVTLNWQKK